MQGLRCLGVGYRIYNKDEIPFKSTVSYKLQDQGDICCLCIKDPVRKEVPDTDIAARSKPADKEELVLCSRWSKGCISS